MNSFVVSLRTRSTSVPTRLSIQSFKSHSFGRNASTHCWILASLFISPSVACSPLFQMKSKTASRSASSRALKQSSGSDPKKASTALLENVLDSVQGLPKNVERFLGEDLERFLGGLLSRSWMSWLPPVLVRSLISSPILRLIHSVNGNGRGCCSRSKSTNASRKALSHRVKRSDGRLLKKSSLCAELGCTFIATPPAYPKMHQERKENQNGYGVMCKPPCACINQTSTSNRSTAQYNMMQRNTTRCNAMYCNAMQHDITHTIESRRIGSHRAASLA